jgi:hypothetical protein
VKRARVRYVEGVPYYPHRVRFQLADGRRRSWVRWSPGFPWVREEVARELDARFGIEAIKPRSCTIEAVS